MDVSNGQQQENQSIRSNGNNNSAATSLIIKAEKQQPVDDNNGKNYEQEEELNNSHMNEDYSDHLNNEAENFHHQDNNADDEEDRMMEEAEQDLAAVEGDGLRGELDGEDDNSGEEFATDLTGGVKSQVPNKTNQEVATAPSDANVWTLPLDKDVCTLDEIRRGQVINGIPPNQCPVIGCGKKINEARAEPSPGTISSGLRTHVLFVHYAMANGRKFVKKRKLGWTTKRRSQSSPRKAVDQFQSQTNSLPSNDGNQQDYRDLTMEPPPKMQQQSQNGSADLLANFQKNMAAALALPNVGSNPGSLLDKKIKQIASNKSLQALQMSSQHQSLMQTSSVSNNNKVQTAIRSSFPRTVEPTRQKNNSNTNTITNMNTSIPTSLPQNNNFNPTTSSLFSILAGITAQQAQKQTNNQLIQSSPQQKQPSSRNQNRTFPNSSSINVSKNSIINHNGMHNRPSMNLSTYDDSIALNQFVESIAIRTGSNIGQAGIAEAKRIIEKFTSSLICSSQTIADHYIQVPFGGDVPLQKPEISSSDVILAYKMMHKSHGQT